MTAQVASRKFVFVTGGTGFMGRRLIKSLLARGHRVRALVQTIEKPGTGIRILNVPDIRRATCKR